MALTQFTQPHPRQCKAQTLQAKRDRMGVGRPAKTNSRNPDLPAPTDKETDPISTTMETNPQPITEKRPGHLLVSSHIWRWSQELQNFLYTPIGPGKLVNRRVATTNSSGANTQCRLFYVWGRRNKLKFLVDTGAAISVVPYQNDHAAKPTLFKLRAANGSVIDTYGERTLTLNIGMRRDFTWTFIVANVKIPRCGFPGALRTGGPYEPQDPIRHNYESPCLRYAYTSKLHRN
ncbi:unnamed protein product [Acanthosepion pharaonis]|uniref:Peptidase A2 domain-containing protein n=1 Tax=Acanthosepion pharaonis TaxID=158019 RepID=A0A812D7M9_ACAPH|nr:unnamed protein product [Sepia pharaonis]